MASHAARGRFQSLDILRGLAALMVTLFHCVNSLPGATATVPGRLLMHGWAGVFLFFPVSGYCIAAALHRAENATVGSFLRRRWRRIYPPYWASIALAVAVALLALPFNSSSPGALVPSVQTWATTLTLTQTFTSKSDFLNPVYWSLCYEEQFYLVMALMLLVPVGRRAMLLTALTLVSAAYVLTPAVHVRGLFLDLWLCFAAGCGAFLVLRARSDRAYGWVMLAIATVMGWLRFDLSLAISVSAAIAMLLVARWDQSIAGAAMLRPAMRLGMMSYSLYLVHVTVASKIVNLLGLRWQVTWWATAACSLVASLLASAVFFWVIERRFLPRASQSAPAIAAPPRRTGYPQGT
jgi:peptidoglycan/LPS O-acetylase OafA/YrhL